MFLFYSIEFVNILLHIMKALIAIATLGLNPLADCRTPEPAQPPRENQFTALAAGGSAVQGTWNIIIITVKVKITVIIMLTLSPRHCSCAIMTPPTAAAPPPTTAAVVEVRKLWAARAPAAARATPPPTTENWTEQWNGGM